MTNNKFSIKNEIEKLRKHFNNSVKFAVKCYPLESFLDDLMKTADNKKMIISFSYYYKFRINISLKNDGKISDVLLFLEEKGIDISLFKKDKYSNFEFSMETIINGNTVIIHLYTIHSKYCTLIDDKTQEPITTITYPKIVICE